MKAQDRDSMPAPAVQPLSPAQVVTRPEMDADTQRILEVCAKSTSKERSELLVTNKEFVVDAGRRQIGYHIRDYRTDRQPFRFMDLPIELRIHIAEFVLTPDTPLVFRWVSCQNGTLIGTFAGMEELTALTRVSKQLHAELADIALACNTTFTFDFDPSEGLPFMLTDNGDDNEETLNSVLSFGRAKANTYRARQITLLLLYDFVPDFGHRDLNYELEDLARTVTSVTRHMPKVQFKVFHYGWSIYRTSLKSIKDVDNFRKAGHKFAAALARCDASAAIRTWKIYPDHFEDERTEVKQALTAAGIEEAEKWIDEGL